MQISQPVTAYVALGSNLGNRAGYINNALRMLAKTDGIRLCRVSKIMETSPLAGKDQPNYLNTVAEIQTTLTLEHFHRRLTDIESALGRSRTEKWSARTIDLDLLLFGQRIVNTDVLTVPHRQMHLRSFVLNGICELNPDLLHPLLNQPVAELAGRLNGADYMLNPRLPQLVSIAGVIAAGKTTLADALAKTLDCKLLHEVYDTNPFLPQVYAGQEELALDSQLYFLNSRVQQLSTDSIQPGEPAISDYIFEKELIYANRTLNAEQLDAYKRHHASAAEAIVSPVLAIYLHCRPCDCLERIHKRNRPYEQRIKLKFLQNLYLDYERLFADWRRCPVIRLAMSDFDCTDTAGVAKLANEVKFYLAI